MNGALLVLLLALAFVAGILLYPRWRRKRLLAAPFPPAWQAVLDDLPLLHGLAEDERAALRDLLRLFLGGKRFYGCNGLEIDDRVRVTIAAQACLLVLKRPGGLYPALRHILVYPEAFWTGHPQFNEDGTVSEASSEMLGESWDEGKVILSWEDVAYGVEFPDDGENVVLHEFAHQLDGESGEVNGVPLLPASDSARWEALLRKEFEALEAAVEAGKETLLDPYGTTNPAEFFAVATECFFELPTQMSVCRPALFEALSAYYRVDPRPWKRRAASS